jgi:hypothetical protein
MKHTVTGTMQIDITATIDAEDVEDAKRAIESADCCVESTDQNIIFNNCCQSFIEIDHIVCDGQKLWRDLSKTDRMATLVGNGASDDAAYEMAGREFFDLPIQWQGYFA